jgi:hypothetical protein
MYIKHQKTYGIPKPSQTCSPESVLYLNDVTPVSWICLRIQPSHCLIFLRKLSYASGYKWANFSTSPTVRWMKHQISTDWTFRCHTCIPTTVVWGVTA